MAASARWLHCFRQQWFKLGIFLTRFRHSGACMHVVRMAWSACFEKPTEQTLHEWLVWILRWDGHMRHWTWWKDWTMASSRCLRYWPVLTGWRTVIGPCNLALCLSGSAWQLWHPGILPCIVLTALAFASRLITWSDHQDGCGRNGAWLWLWRVSGKDRGWICIYKQIWPVLLRLTARAFSNQMVQWPAGMTLHLASVSAARIASAAFATFPCTFPPMPSVWNSGWE